ncbi:hypothetical protein C5708_14435, partial [Caulobacter sp. CCUG 60055]|uniref:outer membrane protein n=1 Tax=Caulobacter sp. CCUG 60055 TaxID=2100090 RepID=UPI001FA7040E
MKLKLLAGACLAAVAVASVASAEDRGWYGALDIGYHAPESIKAHSSNNDPTGVRYNWNWSADNDWAGFARLGYRFTPNWRVELEGGYRPGDLKSVSSGASAIQGLCTPGVTRSAAAPNCGKPNGSFESWTLMANAIYDILPDSPINPFVGAGLGVNHATIDALGQFSNVGAVTAANPAIQNLTVDKSDTAFAWQLIGGLAWKATDRLNVDLTYRYLGGSDLSWSTAGSVATGLQPGKFQGEYRDQSVTLGLRYSFASPPPPPPPP